MNLITTLIIILWAVFCIIIFYVLLIFVVRFSSPRIAKNDLTRFHQECINLFKLEKNKVINYSISEIEKYSCVEVIVKESSYVIHLKQNPIEIRSSLIIHELTHIKTGQSDKYKKIPESKKSRLINFWLDVFYSVPNEIKYHFWTIYIIRKLR